MKSKTLGQMYADLGVTRTHSRPHVSNDNPFSESQFKTLKYRPEFPSRFGSLEHGSSCSRDLIHWYNHEHHHNALGWLTPHDVHYGLAEQRLAQRAAVLEKAYRAHPERFVHGPPKPAALARAVWINPPKHTGDAGNGAEENEAGPEGPAPSVLSPAQRSGCSSAEPYLPNRRSQATSSSLCAATTAMALEDVDDEAPSGLSSCDKPRGLGQSPIPEISAPLGALH